MTDGPPIRALLARAPVVPVLVVDEAADARPLARALVEGGLPLVEVTLRTPAAIAAISAMAGEPGTIVGAGSVLLADDVDRAADAGARFVVSPGFSPAVGARAAGRGLPWLPGVATASDLMALVAHGLDTAKFFPAMTAGGRPALAALAQPFAGVRFCPTGGISEDSAPGWLAEPHVLAVGGSWLAPRGSRDWASITMAARRAAALGRPPGDRRL